MAYTWKMLLDPSSAILIGAASGTILYGSYRSNDFFTHFRESLELDNNVVHTKTAIIMPIVGSVFLVLLFYFLHWIYYLLLGIMALSALSAFGYLVYPFVEFVFQKIGGIFLKGWEIRWIGYVNVTGIASFLISVGVITAWLTTFHYLFTDILAFSLAISALSFVRLPNFKVALLILTLFFFYDIFWVFISPYIFKESVMVSVAVQLPRLPMVIIIPRIASDGFSLLGVGDIVLPGLWLCFLHRFDKLKKTPFLKGYFLKSWIGYILGLILTLLMLLALQRGQPALLYLVPFTIIPAVCFGWKQGELKNLWTGTVETHHFDDLETNTEGDTALLLGDTNTKE